MIEFPLLDIWSKFHRKVIISYYTQSRVRSKESGETEHCVHGAEAVQHVPRRRLAAHASGLGERDHRRHTWRASVFRPAMDVCTWMSV